jgi:hypothetical protein
MASDTVRVFATILALPTITCFTHLATLPGVTDTSRRPILRDPEYQHHCKVLWTQKSDPMYYWDQLCAEAVELFGLPGERYITDLTRHSMTWSFRDDRDAVLFRLKFGGAVK